jgi:hypothetical protein
MAYIGVSPSNGVRRVHTYTATASQTTFSGAGAEGTSLSYKDSNFVDVYQNGIKLGDADYTSTSGTSIVLAQGASVDDLVVVVVFDVFSVADTVSKADGGTFDGNVTMAGTLDVTGNGTVGGTLGVTGASTLTGALSAKGGAVFNEDSADVDFRVESNDSANMFVVNAGTNKIGIGTSSPAHAFSVVSSSDGTGISGDDAFIALFNNAEATDGRNYGVKIQAGSANTDSPLTIKDHDDSNTLFAFRGLGQAEFTNSAADYSLKLTQTNTSADGLHIRQTGGTPNSGSRFYFAGQDETNSKAVIYTNGDFYSRSGTFASFSDESIKQDIKDANSQWDDIKAIKVRNFRLKDEVSADADYPYHIGVIAQEVEASGMNGLVSENLYDTIENEDGTKTEITKKGVKYSILHMKALKALQEAMTRIETLEAEVKALKGE